MAEHTPAPLVFVDTETDGVHDARRAWEIAIIRRDPDGTERERTMLLPLRNLTGSDPFGLRVGRFYDRHPHGRYLSGQVHVDDDTGLWRPHEAAEEVARLTHGAHWVGAVPNFDTEVLARLLRSAGLIPGWHYHLIDVENLVVGYLAATTGKRLTPPWSSTELSEALGIVTPEEEKHTALGDVRWAMRLYDAVLGADRA